MTNSLGKEKEKNTISEVGFHIATLNVIDAIKDIKVKNIVSALRISS